MTHPHSRTPKRSWTTAHPRAQTAAPRGNDRELAWSWEHIVANFYVWIALITLMLIWREAKRAGASTAR